MKMHAGKTCTPNIKKMIAALLMILFYVQMWGADQPTFTEGTELFVVAHSGLTLRAEPDTKSASLGIIDFGSSVIVLPQEETAQYQKINWVEGHWIYVDHEGVTGYMFDGFLSDLPLPIYDFEKCQVDTDLLYPLESWSEINLGLDKSDTITAGTLRRVTELFESGDKMIKTHKNDEYKIELYLSDVRLMDAYHLLQSMLDGKSSIELFKEESTFIENRDGDLYKIMVDLDNPVWIRKLNTGQIKVTIKTLNDICGL